MLSDVARAVRDTIAKNPPAGLPVTTLHADVSGGATTFTIDTIRDSQSRERIVPKSRLTFYDATGERALTVQDAQTVGNVTTITIATAPEIGITGLQYSHTHGTPVYANLLTYGPWDQSAALSLGDPVFFIRTTQKRGRRDVMPSAGFSRMNVRVQSNRQLNRPNKDIDPEIWAEHIHQLTESDLDSIVTELVANQSLITDFWPAAAEMFGDLGGGDLYVMDFLPYPVESGATWHYIGTLDLTVLGVAE